MTTFTKDALLHTFVQMLGERPFDKITVTDLVRACGVNRNTFYYHFQDLYALVDELFRTEAEKILEPHTEDFAWQDAVLDSTRFVRENQTAVYHLYNSLNRDKVEAYLSDVARNVCDRFIEHEAQGLDVDDKVKGDLAWVYAATIEGLVIDWLRTGMREDPESFVRDTVQLLDGTARFALERAERRQRMLAGEKPYPA